MPTLSAQRGSLAVKVRLACALPTAAAAETATATATAATATAATATAATAVAARVARNLSLLHTRCLHRL
jgi:hypothetical protein